MTDDSFDFDNFVATAQARTLTVQVCADGGVAERHAALVDELAATVDAPEAKSLATAPNPEIDRIHDAIRKLEDESAQPFTLGAIGALEWNNLLREHPPRPGRDHRLAFNLATFPPAAVAACSISPKLTPAQATILYGTDEEPGILPTAEWNKLFNATFALNEAEATRPKLPAAIEALLQSVRSSTSAATTELPAPPSSAASDAP